MWIFQNHLNFLNNLYLFEKDRTDVQSQRTQRIDYNRLKHERELEHSNQEYDNGSINPELLEYAYPSYHRSDDGHGKKSLYLIMFLLN